MGTGFSAAKTTGGEEPFTSKKVKVRMGGEKSSEPGYGETRGDMDKGQVQCYNIQKEIVG